MLLKHGKPTIIQLPTCFAGIEAYCLIKCEGEKVQTKTTEKTSKPEWKDRVTFYRKKPLEDIVVEVSPTQSLPRPYIYLFYNLSCSFTVCYKTSVQSTGTVFLCVISSTSTLVNL